MVLRKRKIMTIVIITVLSVLILCGVLAFLYLKTDYLKSKESLFAKYAMQNFEILDMIKPEDTLGIDQALKNNPYKSELNGEIEYTENKGTSAESKKSNINKTKLKVESNVDKTSDYDYKKITIGTDEEDILKMDLFKENNIYGTKLNGVDALLSTDTDGLEKLINEFGLSMDANILEDIDLNSIINFTDEEKSELAKKYLSIVQSNISKNKYKKQSNTLITVNGQDVKTNAYSVDLTLEELNNIYIQVLEQIKNDEIILAKVNEVEKIVKEKISEYELDESLVDTLKKEINFVIEDIKSNNVGNDEIKITVYQNKGKTVRTTIEQALDKITIDKVDTSYVKIDDLQLGDNLFEKYIKLEKNTTLSKNDVKVEYKELDNNEETNNIIIDNSQSIVNDNIEKNYNIQVSNGKYEGILNINYKAEIVAGIDDKVDIEEETIEVNKLSSDKVELVNTFIINNIQESLEKLNSFVSIDEYYKMLQNLKVVKKQSVVIPEETEVSNVEKSRFNSQYEFYESEDLTTDNIVELVNLAEKDLKDVNILLKNGNDYDLGEVLTKNKEKEVESISLSIKKDSNNSEEKSNLLKFLDKVSGQEFDVTLEYDNSGLINAINITLKN